MSAIDDLDGVIEQYHRAAAEFIKGDPEPYKRLFSQRDDVTLGNPFGPVGRGWMTVAGIMDELSPVALRTTSIFRREDGTWKIVHRHADSITTARPPESVIQK